MIWFWLLLAYIPLACAIFTLMYWLVVTTEGVYLGRRVVILLYDIYARRYERIKGYNPVYEGQYLARPLMDAISPLRHPLVLDVATGTCRLPRALTRFPAFNGRVVGVDLSREMLHHGVGRVAEAMHYEQVYLIHAPAEKLPFPDNTFDVITCLEALEFMANPRRVIAELVRVTRPGGLLLLTNRKGPEAKVMPGKAWTPEQAKHIYEHEFGLERVNVKTWQIDYDQVWAWKPGSSQPTGSRPLGEIWLCPRCHQPGMTPGEQQWICAACGQSVPVGKDGVIEALTSM